MKGAAAGVGVAATDTPWLPQVAMAGDNPIVVENAKSGTDEWDLPFLDNSIEGFPAEFSVNAGETVEFKIRTVATNYRVDIYRVGWYGGLGGRKQATILPSVALPQSQPNPILDSYTGLIDCGNWAVSCAWTVPASAVSGIYVANMVRLDVPDLVANRMIFVVRNDGRSSDIFVQTSDTTYQAYNDWGGNSLYFGNARWDRAVKVSYNRPTIITELENEFWYAEYPLVRWLERNGYDVSYTTCIDTDRRPGELLRHKIFVSSGHDEYWSGAQRSNVEAARDAGVNLIFMTGNEVFWRVRWESSVDGSQTPYRTLVCYKETLANAKIDPSPEWTGTWRDTRFSPPSNGGQPENALTGTLFKAINPVEVSDFAIEVPHSYSRLRIWRHTGIDALPMNSKATLTRDTLGYEFNTDGDLPGRPGGLIRCSETTVSVPQVMQDFGKTYVPGIITHYLTMYRSASGALVWSTGTVQWSWGLDEYHGNRPNIPVPVDPRMQQATMNVLADMNVQPGSPQTGLVKPTKSTDIVAPTTTILSPSPGAEVPIGAPVVVSGSSVDAAGVVAAVEVSTDGGTTWHPAVGTSSWSYQFIPTIIGEQSVLVRSIDDSCNIESPKSVQFLGVPRPFPCSLWSPDTALPRATILESTPLELGVRFRTHQPGFARGISFFKAPENSGIHKGRLWTSGGRLLASVDFSNETGSGWQTASLSEPVALSRGVDYVVSYSCPSGRYSADAGYFATGYQLQPLSAPASDVGRGNGLYGLVLGEFPTRAFGAANYWVDVVFDIDNSAAPRVIDVAPANSISSVDPTSRIQVQFDESMDPSSIVLEVRNVDDELVIGSTTLDDATNAAIFAPNEPLQLLTAYRAVVAAAADLSGESITAPVAWTFTTAGTPGSIPTSVWTSLAVPAVASADDRSPIEVGMRFRSDIDGVIGGVRFYKGPDNTGTHIGRVWTISGQLLGSVTFSGESAWGWQEAAFDQAIAITAGTPYVVSYYAPNGGYSANLSFFADSETVRGPLHAVSALDGGPNGLYRYGPGGGFPTNSYQSSNYWVDVVFTVPLDYTAPVPVNWVPSTGLQGVATGLPISVTFNKLIDSATIELSDAAGLPVQGTVDVDGSGRTVRFSPSSALAEATSYTAQVIASTAGTGASMGSPFVWTFHTSTAIGAVPATIWDSSAIPDVEAADDSAAVELGVKFRSDIDGSVTGIRFYRGSGNVGTHVGRVWAADGTLLGSVVFTNETRTGWQQANLDNPVPIVAGTTYVASYLAPNGRYSATLGSLSTTVDRAPLHTLPSGPAGGNGVFSYGTGAFPTNSFGSANYWIDVVFADAVGPSVGEYSPASNARDVPVSSPITVDFDEPVDPGSIEFTLLDAQGATVPGTLTYDSTARRSTFAPSGSLAPISTYTASVTAGADLAGNPISQPVIWSFTTIDNSLVTLFAESVPAISSSDDSSALELGMRFKSTQFGRITGLRFYKGAANTGNHVGHLWSNAGNLLATASFSNESITGWQVATLDNPVEIEPGTIYIASYYAPNGGFALNYGFFEAGDYVQGPLVAVGTSTAPNGLFRYGVDGGFPTGSVGGSNYWVDVVFRPAASAPS